MIRPDGRGTPPMALVIVPLEGPVLAFTAALSDVDAQRLAANLARRNVHSEVQEALDALLDALDAEGTR